MLRTAGSSLSRVLLHKSFLAPTAATAHERFNANAFNLSGHTVRISLRKQPVLRDRVFGVVLATALLHGGYLVTGLYDQESK